MSAPTRAPHTEPHVSAHKSARLLPSPRRSGRTTHAHETGTNAQAHAMHLIAHCRPRVHVPASNVYSLIMRLGCRVSYSVMTHVMRAGQLEKYVVGGSCVCTVYTFSHFGYPISDRTRRTQKSKT